jgi:hypothetical protein
MWVANLCEDGSIMFLRNVVLCIYESTQSLSQKITTNRFTAVRNLKLVLHGSETLSSRRRGTTCIESMQNQYSGVKIETEESRSERRRKEVRRN